MKRIATITIALATLAITSGCALPLYCCAACLTPSTSSEFLVMEDGTALEEVPLVIPATALGEAQTAAR